MKSFSERQDCEPELTSDSRDSAPVTGKSKVARDSGLEHDERLRDRAREIALKFPISDDQLHKVVALLKSNI